MKIAINFILFQQICLNALFLFNILFDHREEILLTFTVNRSFYVYNAYGHHCFRYKNWIVSFSVPFVPRRTRSSFCSKIELFLINFSLNRFMPITVKLGSLDVSFCKKKLKVGISFKKISN